MNNALLFRINYKIPSEPAFALSLKTEKQTDLKRSSNFKSTKIYQHFNMFSNFYLQVNCVVSVRLLASKIIAKIISFQTNCLASPCVYLFKRYRFLAEHVLAPFCHFNFFVVVHTCMQWFMLRTTEIIRSRTFIVSTGLLPFWQ